MNYLSLLLINFLLTSSHSIRYGLFRDVQLMSINASNIQLNNISSLSQCLCRSQQIDSMTIIALNFFSNGTCQLFNEEFFSRTKFYLNHSSTSQLVVFNESILNRIQSIRCADISWVMNQIQREETFRNQSVQEPYSFAMNPETELIFITFKSNSSSSQLTMNAGDMITIARNSARVRPLPVIYYNNYFYVATDLFNSSLSKQWYIYNSSINRISNITFPLGAPQRAIWLFNSTLMAVIIRQGKNSTLQVVNWLYSISPFSYSLNRSIPIPLSGAYGLAKSPDDSFVYVSGDVTTIYQISTKTWNWSILVPPNNSSIEIPMALAVDSCGERLWVLFYGFGLRIYDRFTGEKLIEWNLSNSYPTLVDMILTDNYELYLIDTTMNQLIHYGLPLQS